MYTTNEYYMHYILLLQTPVNDEKTGETKEKVSAFIVERSFGGVSK